MPPKRRNKRQQDTSRCHQKKRYYSLCEFDLSDLTLSQPQPKKTPNLQALTNPNPKQPHPIQPTP